MNASLICSERIDRVIVFFFARFRDDISEGFACFVRAIECFFELKFITIANVGTALIEKMQLKQIYGFFSIER